MPRTNPVKHARRTRTLHRRELTRKLLQEAKAKGETPVAQTKAEAK